MELRFYCFVNYYLSSIQQGVQTGHCAVDLVRRYSVANNIHNAAMQSITNDWADNYKTFIILNGGNNESLLEAFLTISGSGYPYASFSEDHKSLGGIMTCVGVVLPACIFNAKVFPPKFPGQETLFGYDEELPNGEFEEYIYGPDHELYDLTKLVKESRLAS